MALSVLKLTLSPQQYYKGYQFASLIYEHQTPPLFSGRYWALCQSNGPDMYLLSILLHLDSRWWERRVWKLWSWLWSCPLQLPWGGLRMSHQLSDRIYWSLERKCYYPWHCTSMALSFQWPQIFGKIPHALGIEKKFIFQKIESLVSTVCSIIFFPLLYTHF